MSVSQTARSDTPNDARHGSDDEESHNGTSRNSGYVVHSADVHPTMSEAAVRSTGMHSRPVQTGPICTTPGTCSCKLEYYPLGTPIHYLLMGSVLPDGVMTFGTDLERVWVSISETFPGAGDIISNGPKLQS